MLDFEIEEALQYGLLPIVWDSHRCKQESHYAVPVCSAYTAERDLADDLSELGKRLFGQRETYPWSFLMPVFLPLARVYFTVPDHQCDEHCP